LLVPGEDRMGTLGETSEKELVKTVYENALNAAIREMANGYEGKYFVFALDEKLFNKVGRSLEALRISPRKHFPDKFCRICGKYVSEESRYGRLDAHAWCIKNMMEWMNENV
jgi:hypothetical protein